MKYLSKAEGLDNVVKVEYEDVSCEVILDNIPKHKNVVISEKVYDKKITVLDMLYISDKTIYLYLDKDGKLNVSESINALYQMKYLLISKITKKNVYFFGYIANKNNGKFDDVYLNDKKIGKVKRFLKFWQFKHIGMIKVPMKEVETSNEIHNSVRVGKSTIESVAIRTKKFKKKRNEVLWDEKVKWKDCSYTYWCTKFSTKNYKNRYATRIYKNKFVKK